MNIFIHWNAGRQPGPAAAEQVDEVIEAFRKRLAERETPAAQHEGRTLTTGGLLGKKRPYYLVWTRTGATLATYIAPFGKDLYLAWDLFIRPVWRWGVIVTILGLAALLAIPAATTRSPWGGTRLSFGAWLSIWIGLAFFFSLLMLGAGFTFKRNPLAFFLGEIDFFDADDITALTIGVHKSLLQAVDSVGIDTSLLRVKEQFWGGRRDRLI